MFEASVVLTVLMILTALIPYGIRSPWLYIPACLVWVVIWGYACLVATLFFFVPAVGTLYIWVAIAYVFARVNQLNWRWFQTICLACALFAYGIAIAEFIPAYRDHQELLARYPLVDLKPRLSYELIETPPTATNGLNAPYDIDPSPKYQSRTLNQLDETMREYLDLSTFNFERRKTNQRMAFQALMKVHEGFVADFIAQPGVGRSRIPRVMLLRKSSFHDGSDGVHLDAPPDLIDQPQIDSQSPVIMEIVNRSDSSQAIDSRHSLLAPLLATPIPEETRLQQLHLHSIANFAPRNSLGGVNKKIEARGFGAHAFHIAPGNSVWPDGQVDWRLSRLELVSLLKHRPAAAYVSDHLPAMDELKDAPTRPLTDIESRALPKLVDGEDLVVERSDPDEITMIGAIRAINDCRDCHRVPYGGLLGAFSYRLTLQPKSPPASQNVEQQQVSGNKD